MREGALHKFLHSGMALRLKHPTPLKHFNLAARAVRGHTEQAFWITVDRKTHRPPCTIEGAHPAGKLVLPAAHQRATDTLLALEHCPMQNQHLPIERLGFQSEDNGCDGPAKRQYVIYKEEPSDGAKLDFVGRKPSDMRRFFQVTLHLVDDSACEHGFNESLTASPKRLDIQRTQYRLRGVEVIGFAN